MLEKNNVRNKIESEKLLFAQLKDLTPPVHVAVICPPQAAITLLLNKMARQGGSFVVMQSLPMQVGPLAKMNGQPNIHIYPLLIFSIQKKTFEAWMKCVYEEVCMYQMDDIMNDKIMSRELN